jgi:hypothetical protein
MGIAKTGEPAFQARCEAWPMGPVFPEFYHNPQRIAGSPDLLSLEQQGIAIWLPAFSGPNPGEVAQPGVIGAIPSGSKQKSDAQTRKSRSQQSGSNWL